MVLMIRKRIAKWGEPANRTPKEQGMDKLLLLHLIKRSNKNRRKPGITKLQKTVFLIEETLNSLKWKALNYKFFKKHYGPMSKEIYEDFTQFVEGRFITEGPSEITTEGDKVLDHFGEVLERNGEFLSNYNENIDYYCKYNLDELMDIVYTRSFFIPELGAELMVSEIPQNIDILYKVTEKNAEFVFDISDEEVEELDLCLNMESVASLREAEMDVKNKKLLSYEEIF